MNTTWVPIGRSDDAQERHVHQAKLLGRELAVWRADDGFLNVWENRCLHRGVRLSIGLNLGSELKCIYHGWRYSNRTGGCTYIPAHPADAPAQAMCNKTYPSLERYGLMWTAAHQENEPQPVEVLETGSAFALRSLPFNAAPELVVEHLEGYRFHPSSAIGSNAEVDAVSRTSGPLTLESTSSTADASGTVVLFVQPVDSGQCVVHSVLANSPAKELEVATYKHHAIELARIRDVVEPIAASLPAPIPLEPALERIEPSEQGVPSPRSRTDAELRVVVERKWDTAIGVAGFELTSIGDPLPTVQPGAHIDVHLPNGLVRQYSLTNPAGLQDRYVIGVKREPESQGGSSCLHDTVREGDVLAISAPRSNFGLRRDAVQTILIAGGIGITPLLSMAETLAADDHPFTLHYFAQSSEHLAFEPRLTTLGAAVHPHLGLDPAGTGEELRRILTGYEPAFHIYICGPGPMLEATRVLATDQGWPDESIHFEYFKNTNEIDDTTTFEVSLARSGITLPVTAGETILEVLRANGIAMASSCEQGACGTCVVGLIDGEAAHQDVYLNQTERDAGDRIVTCVSRAASDRLILDI